MRKNRGRGFRGQLKLDITRLERQKAKLERRVQKMIQELMMIDNLIKAMEEARNPEAITPAVEALQVTEGTEKANAEMDEQLNQQAIVEAIVKADPQPEKEVPNVQTEG